MKLHRGKGHYTSLAEINITPFVDVVLVLLIIFMITAPLLREGLAIDVPKAEAGKMTQNEKDVILSIDKGNRIYIGKTKKPISLQELNAKLHAIYRNKSEKNLLIQGDRSLRYDQVIDVMVIAKKAGVERIGLITESAPK